MIKKIKEIWRELKAIGEVRIILLELTVALKELSAKHTTDADFRKTYLEEISRIEQSIKFEIMDLREVGPKLDHYMEEITNKLVRLNNKADEIERKVTNLDYQR